MVVKLGSWDVSYYLTWFPRTGLNPRCKNDHFQNPLLYWYFLLVQILLTPEGRFPTLPTLTDFSVIRDFSNTFLYQLWVENAWYASGFFPKLLAHSLALYMTNMTYCIALPWFQNAQKCCTLAIVKIVMKNRENVAH